MSKAINLNKKMYNATKWSTLAEIIAKVIVPITNMVLARILSPEAFGVIATITMITSFGDMITDAGFQKYLIQQDFKNKKNLYEYANVAFIVNLTISLFMWIIICIFRKKISMILGSNNLQIALCISTLQLPITAFSSIQMALYKKELEFKTLFLRRIISILMPFFITIPLAIIGFDYWSLIIGNLVGIGFNAIVLTVKSEWKPNLFFKISILRDMLNFSVWSLIESITVWLSTYIDTIIIGNMLSEYYLGIYKSSVNMINSIMGIVTMAITPVLISGLSKVKSDKKEYNNLLFKTQSILAWLVFPLGLGIFVYRNLAVNILFGNKWSEAADILGIIALTMPFKITLSNMCSICYISKGKPKVSVIAQLLFIIPLIPISILSLRYGFNIFIIIRNLFTFELIIVNLFLINYVIKVPAIIMCKSIIKPLISSIIMCIICEILKIYCNNSLLEIVSILIGALAYIVVMIRIDRSMFNSCLKILKSKVNK